jgi:ceramide glucosyltransferase
MLIHSVNWLLSGLALAGAGYALIVARLVWTYRAQSTPHAPHRAVTILKPLHFDEPGLSKALGTFLLQDYSAPVQVVFGVQDYADPAIETVRDLQRKFPQADIELVIDTALHGSNRKVSNLINMSARAKHDILIVSDSDISVRTDWLKRVSDELSADGVGAVSCLYAGRPAGNFWSTLSAMGSSYEFLPNVIAALSFGLDEPCFGSTIAIRRDTLEAVGGFQAFANHLADDYEMGRAVRAKGLKVAISDFTVDHTSAECDMAALYRHEVRWNRTTRVINRAGHTGSFITHAVPLGLFAAAVGDFSAVSLGILGTTVASRLVLKWCIERKFATYAGPFWALPVRDVLSFFVFAASFFGEDVHWRGMRFAVSPSGALSQS